MLEPHCSCGGKIAARGALENLSDSAYESGDEHVGDSDDVEAAACWTGPPGVLTKALAECGGDTVGFVEEDPAHPGWFIIHDLFDHAPAYVVKRASREAERKKHGETISDVRRKAAVSRWSKPKGAQGENASGMQTDPLASSQDAKVLTRAPAPAPAPALVHDPDLHRV